MSKLSLLGRFWPFLHTQPTNDKHQALGLRYVPAKRLHAIVGRCFPGLPL